MNAFFSSPLFWIFLLLLLLFMLFVFLLLLFLLLRYLIWARGHGRFPYQRFPPAEYYIQDQVVVTGPEARVNAVMSNLPGIASSPIRVLRLADILPPGGSCAGLPPDLLISLYQLTGASPDVARAIAQIRQAAGVAADVIGEPNYIAGHPWSPEGSPWSPEGSPWEPEGSPWSPEGSPWSPEGSGLDILTFFQRLLGRKKTAQAAHPDWFMQQWAWRVIGLPVAQVGQPYPLPVTGSGVRVGIFDTSPYFPALAEGQSADKNVTLAQIPGAETLHVSHPRFYAHLAPSTRPLPDVSNHGYYVAGLIHALAPAAQLHLLRVLASDDRGDTFSLVAAIFDFLSLDNVSGVIPPTVINLSLGIRVPPEEAGFGLPADVLSLGYILRAARCLGAVTLAAAGNDSAGQSAPEVQNIPASWNAALGVAAVNPQLERSCFSNRGEIAAPGGDGRLARQAGALKPGESASGGLTNNANSSGAGCQPRSSACSGPDCPYSVIGPVLDPSTPAAGYIFWTGTSFATPMVSGLAALVVEYGRGLLPPEMVEQILICGATKTSDPALGAGVINVRSTLACAQKITGEQPPRGPQAG